MRNKIFLLTLCYCIGLWSANLLNLSRYNFYLIFMVLLLIAISSYLMLRKKQNGIPLAVIMILIGFLNYNYSYYAKDLGDEYQDKNVKLKGTIVEIKKGKTSSTLTVMGNVLEDSRSLLEKEYKAQVIVQREKALEASIGNNIVLEGRVTRLPIVMDRGTYNRRLVLKEKAVDLYIINPSADIDYQSYSSIPAYYYLKNKSTSLIGGLLKSLLDDGVYQFALATVIGEKEETEAYNYEDFNRAGVSHLLVISGLHVTLIIYWLSYILSLLIRDNRRSFIIIILFIALYCILTGLSPSTLRASFLVLCHRLSELIGRRYNRLSALSLGGLLMLLINPLTLFLPSFQLSFGAILGIDFLMEPINRLLKGLYRPISSIISISLAVQIFTAPIVLYHFNTISVISIISNLLILPIFSIAMPLLFVILIGGLIIRDWMGFLTFIYSQLIYIIVKITNWLSSYKYSELRYISPPISSIIIYYTSLLALFSSLKIKKVTILLLGLIGITLTFTIQIYNPLHLKVYFIDVGQGDCILLRAVGGSNILIDTGQQSSTKFSVVPYLRKKGVQNIDYLIITHDHSDHIGGLDEILSNFRVDRVVFPENNFKSELYYNALLSLKNRDITYDFKYANDKIKINEGSYFEVVHPDWDFARDNTDSNEGSLVVRYNYKELSILLTGDIGMSTEERIIKRQNYIKSDILKVPHHGSNLSSSTNFINKVDPNLSVIQVGYNRFGHPGDKTLERLNRGNNKVMTTIEYGTVTVTSNGRWIKIKGAYDTSN